MLRVSRFVLLAAVLALTMLAASLPSVAAAKGKPHAEVFEPGAADRDPGGERAGRVGGSKTSDSVEVTKWRTEHSRTFQAPVGFETEISQTRLHFRDGDSWTPIDNRLVRASGGGWRNAANDVSVQLPSKASGDVTVTADGATVSFRLREAGRASATVSGAVAVYSEVVAGVDAQYTAVADGVKEDLVLKAPGSPRSFTFDVTADAALTAAGSGAGGIDFVDADGNVALRFDAPVLVDAAGVVSNAATLTIAQHAPLVVTLTAEDGWLDESDRAWPVRLDPTLVSDGPSDNRLESGSGADANFCGSHTFDVGTDTSSRVRRPLLDFKIDNSFPYAGVVAEATLELYQTGMSGTTGSYPTSVHQVDASWVNCESTWNSRSSGVAWSAPGGDFNATAEDTNNDVGTTTTGWRSWDLTELTQRWVDGTADDYGVLLKAVNEAATPEIDFASNNNTDASVSPKLTVRWWPPMGHRDWYTYESQDLAATRSVDVNVASGNLMVNEVDATLQSVGMPLRYARTYNSIHPTNRPFGEEWQAVLEGRPAVFHGDDVKIYEPDGAPALYRKQADGSYKPMLRTDSTLKKNGDGSFTLSHNRTGVRRNYTSSGRLDTVVDRNGNRHTWRYNSSGNVVSVTDTQGRATTLTWSSGEVSKVTDPAGREHLYAYTDGVLTGYTDPAGNTTTYTTNTSGILTRITDASGREVRFEYDSGNTNGLLQRRVKKIIRVTDAAAGTGPTTSFAYFDGRTEVTDERGHVTTYHHNRKLEVRKVVDANGRERATEYDSNSNVASYTGEANGTATVNTYSADGRDNLLNTVGAEGETSVFTYNDPDNLFAPDTYQSPQGNTLTYDYDTKGNLGTVTDSTTAPPGATTISRNSDGTVDTVTDQRGKITDYDYQGGHLTDIDPPGTTVGTTSLEYDSLSRVSAMTDGKGRRTTYTYDKLDRLTSVTFDTAATVVYAYDEVGNRTSMTDPTGATTTTYDDLNRITQELLPGPRTNTYTYDAASNLATLTDAGGTVTYTYNNVNLLTSLSDPDSLVTRFGYDGRNNRTCTSYPNGVEQRSTFDRSDKITVITGGTLTSGRAPCTDATTSNATVVYDASDIATGIATVHTKFSYGYTDGAASTLLRSSVTDHDGTVTTYDYDQLDRLVGALTKTAGGATVSNYGYGYDKASNRVRQTVDGRQIDYAYGDANELTHADVTVANVVLLVGNPAALTTADAALKARLETSLGHAVTTRDDGAAATDDADVIVIGESVTGSTVGTKYRDVAVPVVSLERALNDEMAFASAQGDLATTSTLSIVDAAHPIANGPHGAVSGTISHTTSAQPTGASAHTSLPTSAQRVADRGSSASAVFAFDGGDVMSGGVTAASKRVALGYTDDVVPALTAAGWTLFDNAVAWALRTSYRYDANGAQTGDDQGGNLVYSTARQTTSMRAPGGSELTAGYAGDDQFDRRSTNVATFTPTILGVSARLGEYSRNDYYTRDAGGTLLARRRYNTSDGSLHERDYYLTDGLGSVAAVTRGGDGSVDKRYSYDPYGTTTSTDSNDSNPWRYAGEYQDDRTGMYKIGHRYYQPDLGRWTQRDPLQHRINPAQPAEHNPYTYVGCNPVNFTDPSGMAFLPGYGDCFFSMLGTAFFLTVAIFTGPLWLIVATAIVGGVGILGSCGWTESR